MVVNVKRKYVRKQEKLQNLGAPLVGLENVIHEDFASNTFSPRCWQQICDRYIHRHLALRGT